MKSKYCLVLLCSILISLTNCSNLKSNSDYLMDSLNNNALSNKTKSPIDIMSEYVLSHYLDKGFCIYFPNLYFVTNNKNNYSLDSFIPNKYINYVKTNDGFTKLDKDSIPKCKELDLDDDIQEKDWYLARIEYPFLVKDYLDLLIESKNKDYIYFVYGSRDGGSQPVPPKLPVLDNAEPLDNSLMNSHAIRLFDCNHNGLEGYYNEFNVCISHQSSGIKDYSFKDLFPSFYLNDTASFAKINDEDTISSLDASLPEESIKTNRDWYKLIFPFKFEAQYALQLFKELEKVSGIFYATSYLNTDESLDIQVPQFRIL